MSHIPATAVPHAKANGDTAGEHPPAPGQKQPTPDRTDPAPLTSQAPATATGNREGSAPDRAAREAGQPRTTVQPPVDGTVTAQDRPSPKRSHERRSRLGSPLGIAAVAVGGLAVVGGVAAALFPRVQPEHERKSKKRRRKDS